MVCEPRSRRYLRSAGLVVFLVVAVFALEAQVTTELSEQAIAEGERVSYVITIDHEEPTDVEVRSPDFPGLRVVEGPTIRPVSILSGSERSRSVEVRFTFEATAAGRYVLPAVPVNVAGQPYLTSTRLLEIGERRDRSRVPFLARWVGPRSSLSTGEVRVFSLEIYNVTEYVYPSSISMGSPENAIFEEVQGLGSIEQYTVDGVTLYAIPVAVFMVTPSQAGSVELPEAEIQTETLSAVAPTRTIDVREIPAAVEDSGAIGRFSYDVEVEPTTVLLNEAMTLRLRVSGTGNLHYLALPEPQLTGFQIEDDTATSSVTPTSSGYEGYRERILTLRPSQSDRYAIEPGEFVFLDPGSNRVSRAQPPGPVVNVVDPAQPAGGEGESPAIELMSIDEIAAMERRIWYRDPLGYGWLVPGLLVFIGSRIFRRHHVSAMVLIVCASFLMTDAVSSRLPWEDIERGMRRYDEGDLSQAIYDFERASRSAGESPGINYNLSVLYFKTGDIPRAVYAVRETVRLAPFAGAPRDALKRIEQAAGIERSVPPPHLVHPDFFFFVVAILVNGLLVGMAFWGGAKRGFTTIIGILAVVLILGSTLGLVLSAVRQGEQLGIVREDLTLRRIPGAEADGWLPVRSGSAVEVLARHENSLLVQTVLGLEGWVELEDVIWSESPLLSLVRYRGFAL